MKAAYRDFEHTFDALILRARRTSISIKTLLTILSGRGKILVLIFLALGFMQIPGIGLFLGLIIAYLGIRIAMGNRFVWCPRFMLQKKIPSTILLKVLKQTLQILHFVKRGSKTRFEWAKSPTTLRLNGVVISIVGLCVASAPPIPLTGLLASVSIFLIAIGFLNFDGLYLALGYISAVAYCGIVLVLLKYVSITKICGWIVYQCIGR